MSEQYILAIDVGTTEIKAALVSHQGEIRDCTRSTSRVLHPQPTWAEQDPNDWWHSVCSAVRELWRQSHVSPNCISGLVFSTQMFGVLPVDIDGKPLTNAMIWLDTRSREQARRITAGFPTVGGYGLWKLIKWLRTTNGAPNLAGRDTISKFIWLREERPDVWERTHKLLDVKDYLLLRCTGRAVSTYDEASGGWLFNTKKGELDWSQPILDMLELSSDILPTVIRSTEVAGELLEEAASDLGLPIGTPVIAGAGDVASCAVGTGAVRDGDLHLSLGTSSWLASHLDHRAVNPFAATGTLCAAEYGKYLLIATQETAGASLDWARRNVLGGEELADFSRVNQLVEACEPGSGGVFFFPWLAGERVPVDDSAVRGGFVNLAIDHDQRHLARAIFEGVAYNTRWALGAVEKLLGRSTTSMRIAGGGAQSDAWCQTMADVLERRIERVAHPQYCGVRGAALIALRALGEIPNLEATGHLVPVTDRFEPRRELSGLHADRYAHYVRYYRRNRAWFRSLNEGR